MIRKSLHRSQQVNFPRGLGGMEFSFELYNLKTLF